MASGTGSIAVRYYFSVFHSCRKAKVMNVVFDTNGVKRVHSTTGAFLVDFEDATLRAWGDNDWSGKIPTDVNVALDTKA